MCEHDPLHSTPLKDWQWEPGVCFQQPSRHGGRAGAGHAGWCARRRTTCISTTASSPCTPATASCAAPSLSPVLISMTFLTHCSFMLCSLS